MQLTPDTMTLAILAFPGFTASYIYRKLRGAKLKTDWAIVFESLFFSVMSYTLWFLIVAPIAWRWPTIAGFDGTNLLNAITANHPTPLIEPSMAILLIGATAISAGLALLAAFIHARNYINVWGQDFKLTKRAGDEDVWEIFLTQVHNPIVRDARTKRTYYGILTNYSETDEKREIALENVKVYDEDGTPLYALSRLYISREPGDITLEFDPTSLPDIIETEATENGPDIAGEKNG